MCKDFDLMDNYDGIDFNDKQFEEAIRSIETKLLTHKTMGNIRPFWRAVQRAAKTIMQRRANTVDMYRRPAPSPDRKDQLLSGLICALMLIIVWFLIMIFH